MSYFLSAVLGYFSGSIPFGLILAQLAGLGDIRKIGSGNIGATNVLRTGNKKIAALTVLCDVLKGTIPVLLAQYFWGQEAAIVGAVHKEDRDRHALGCVEIAVAALGVDDVA